MTTHQLHAKMSESLMSEAQFEVLQLLAEEDLPGPRGGAGGRAHREGAAAGDLTACRLPHAPTTPMPGP
ncbi:hypothetical protein [Streptomyces sp. ISL-86]|uniref:hypothetical protein n=1 Tax=Streptomyces sp. ISL-86 TaxID=2819187 RepID=UPI001BEBD609|nr:hypothetical protein [Streptomyces sp. ISL-86]MBT2459360.1 hypothetical protein [Streptomyces sp. ISL-86]